MSNLSPTRKVCAEAKLRRATSRKSQELGHPVGPMLVVPKDGTRYLHSSVGPRAQALRIAESRTSRLPSAQRMRAVHPQVREAPLGHPRPHRATLLIGRVFVGTFAAILWECVFTVLYWTLRSAPPAEQPDAPTLRAQPSEARHTGSPTLTGGIKALSLKAEARCPGSIRSLVNCP